jgi:tubulin polyglutamylase TTLL9
MSEYFRRYIKKEHYPTPPSNIKFKTSFKNCVYDGLMYREWKETYGDDWNLMWCEK